MTANNQTWKKGCKPAESNLQFLAPHTIPNYVTRRYGATSRANNINLGQFRKIFLLAYRRLGASIRGNPIMRDVGFDR
jgi:hypothetical protein